jgi:hypothetical protein
LNADGTVPPNYANYDESKATAGSPVPPLLVMNDGRKITTRTLGSGILAFVLWRALFGYGRQREVAQCSMPERYWGCKQRLKGAVNDRIGIEPEK